MKISNHAACLAGGFLIGTAGVKLLTSRDAKKGLCSYHSGSYPR